MTIPPSSMAPTRMPTTNLARFTAGTGAGIDILDYPTRTLALFETAMQTGINDRYKKQRGDRGKQQAPDDRAAQGSILLGALAPTQGHGNHPDDHRQGGHQHRPDASRTRIAGRTDRIQAFVHALPRERYDQNAIGGGHAHGHDGAGESRHAQGRRG